MLLDRRLLVVTGKGGVGKTTVAAALGLVAARTGKRTIVAEVAQRGDVASAFDREGAKPFEEVELAPGLFHISIDPQDALEEYLRDQLPSGAVAELLIRSKVFAMVAAATPGMRELLTVGKLWELAQLDRRTPGAGAYDLVVVDAPATGHGVAVLSAPRTFAAAAGSGPVARQGTIIDAMLSDPQQIAVIAVAKAEELAVTETGALRTALRGAHGPAARARRREHARRGPLQPARGDAARAARRPSRGRARVARPPPCAAPARAAGAAAQAHRPGAGAARCCSPAAPTLELLADALEAQL